MSDTPEVNPDGEPVDLNLEDLVVEEPPAVEGAPAPPPPDEPAVVIYRVIDGQGNISTEVKAQGDVRATEIETLIKLGLSGWQRQIGV